MRGITTAGETAASTAPMTAASILEMPSKAGARRTYPIISKVAGRKDIKMAGRPTFFRSERFKDSPALIRMMIRAICRRSEETDSTESSSRFRTYGPSKMPASSMPMIRGSFSFSKTDARSRPDRKISASDVNIKTSLHCDKKCNKKSWWLCKSAEVISLYTSGLVKTRENFIPTCII